MRVPTRDEAWQLLAEFTQSEALRNHARAVEAAMRAYAARFDEDVELWGVTGLLHDFDYERYPSLADHPWRGSEILLERGVRDDIRTAIMGHGDHTGVPRETRMAKTLFAVDELTGFLTACALVRPSKKIAEVGVDSVKKKMKDKAFARGVNRDDIRKGADELGVPIDEHIVVVRDAMASIASDLGLAGSA